MAGLNFLGWKTVGRGLGQPLVAIGAGALGKSIQDKEKRTLTKEFEGEQKGLARKGRGSTVLNIKTEAGFATKPESELAKLAYNGPPPKLSTIPNVNLKLDQVPCKVVEVAQDHALDEIQPVGSNGEEGEGVSDQIYDFSSSRGRFSREFQLLDTLGRGGFGSVHRVRHKLDGAEYAIKGICLSSLDDQTLREVQVMAKLRGHDHIVNYHGCWLEPLTDDLKQLLGLCADLESSSLGATDLGATWATEGATWATEGATWASDSYASQQGPPPSFVMFVQMDLCAPDTLSDWLSKKEPGSHSREFVCHMFDQLADAVAHLHEQGFIHRDIKPANIFFQPPLPLVPSATPATPATDFPVTVKLGDFGLVSSDLPGDTFQGHDTIATAVPPDNTAGVGTATYAAPEQLKRRNYDHHADIYSLGMVLGESFCGPFDTTMERLVTLQSIREGVIPTSFAHSEPLLADLVLRMVSKDAKARPGAREVQAILRCISPNTSFFKPLSNPISLPFSVLCGLDVAKLLDAPGKSVTKSAPPSQRHIYDRTAFKQESFASYCSNASGLRTSTSSFVPVEVDNDPRDKTISSLEQRVREQEELIGRLQNQLLETTLKCASADHGINCWNQH